MTQILTQMQNTSFAYVKDLVIDNVSLQINKGDFIGVIGPNGSGKSTLLKLIGALLQKNSGTILFKDSDLSQLKRKHLARSIAWIPQEHSMVFPFKVMEIVLMGRHPYIAPMTFEREEDHKIAQAAMKITDTLQFADRTFNQISGGEKQRVMIASAIAQEPEMMLLDEPTSALDLKYQLEILSILNRLNQENRTTMVLAMHDLHLASRFCRSLVLLNEGRVIKIGTPEEVLQIETLEKVYGIKVKIIRDEEDGSFIILPGSPCK